jgi:transcription antitermination factor NusG
MATASIHELPVSACEGLRSHYLGTQYVENRWYAAYTSANHEKRVRQQCEERCVTCFLPVYETVRRWKDRRMHLQLPLFPGYVFVRMALTDRVRVLQLPGVVRLVGFGGNPFPLPDEEIEGLRKALAAGIVAEPHPFLTVGRRVGIKNGPFAGRQGILLRRKGSLRVVLSVDLIRRSVVVDVEAENVEPLAHRGVPPCESWTARP